MNNFKYEGAWRPVNRQEWERLKAQGENVDWIEGAGLIVYDKQALDEMISKREAQ